MAVKAYGQYTIVDIVDGFDWLGDFSSAPSNPQKNQAYYNTTDKKTYAYDGEKWVVIAQSGEKGDTGNGIEKTLIKYFVTNSKAQPEDDEAWSTQIPTVESGDYLWIRTTLTYTNGKTQVSYSVSYNGENGLDGNTYQIELNPEIVYKLYDGMIVVNDVEQLNVRFSPSSLNIQVFNVKKDERQQIKCALNLDNIEFSDYTLEAKLFYGSNSDQELLTIEYHKDKNTDGSTTQNDYEYYTILNPIQSIENTFLRIDLKRNGILVAQKIMDIHFMTSKEALDLDLNADGIVASIREKKLEFNAEGLTISNGGFQIKKTDDKDSATVLEATIDGNLILNDIEAQSGTIGGFTITKGSIVSADNKLKLLNDENGGKIVATNIDIGSGANIANYIKLGNSAYILNPSHNENYFLGVGELFDINNQKVHNYSISLTQDGILNLGNIVVNGSESKISGINFTITPEVSTFNNLYATSAQIENVVYKTSTTQAVGGLMIFKPSFYFDNVVKESDNYVLSNSNNGDDLEFFEIGDFVRVDSNIEGTIISKTDGQLAINFYKKPITDDFIKYLLTKKILIKLSGTVKNASNELIGLKDNILIGVNSNPPTDGAKSDSNINRASLTITTAELKDSQITYPNIPNLVLGDLSTIGENGFGLYSDNVFLRGQLVTKKEIIDGGTTKFLSAGINTNSTTETPEGNIILWAGAKSLNQDNYNISASSFYVTNEGYLYATKGHFSNGLISDSIIEATEIKTATIGGKGNGGLKIIDTSLGIGFYYREDDLDILKYKINNDGFYEIEAEKEVAFVDFSPTGGVNFNGKELKIEKISSGTFTFNGGDDVVTFYKGNSELIAINNDNTTIKNQLQATETFKIIGSLNSTLIIKKVGEGYGFFVE